MTAKRATLGRRLTTIVTALMVGGCVDWAGPLPAGGRPALGSRLPVHLYALADSPACGADVDTFRCDGAQHAVVGRPSFDIAALTLAHRGDELFVQARSLRPQVKGSEYAVARGAANGVYLIGGIDEQDADDATRAKFSTKNATERDALMAFVEATATRPDRKRHRRSLSTGADASA